MACKRKVAIGLFGFWTGMGEFGGRDRVHCLIFCTILLQQNLNKTCEKYEENIKCVDCRDRLCGFGTQILNEFPENINKIWRIFSESKTWSKYSNRIPYDGTGNVSIQICQMQRWGNIFIFTISTFDSSWATSSKTSLWACSSCWGLARSKSVVKFWSSQGARWWRASRGKWSPVNNKGCY